MLKIPSQFALDALTIFSIGGQEYNGNSTTNTPVLHGCFLIASLLLISISAGILITGTAVLLCVSVAYFSL